MKTTWKHLYLWVKAAVLNLDSVDSLFRQIVKKISVTYQADCLLWTGLEVGVSDNIWVYTTPEIASQLLPLGLREVLHQQDSDQNFDPDNSPVRSFRPHSPPQWFLDQQYSPQLTQLETGDLIIPITIRGGFSAPTIQELNRSGESIAVCVAT